MARFEAGITIQKALKGIEELKYKSLKKLEKNYLTISNLQKNYKISRNNFSKSYIKKYPEWLEVRNIIECFGEEFKKAQLQVKHNPVIEELKINLNNALKQNLELIKEVKFLNDYESLQISKYENLLAQKKELEIELNKNI